MIYNHRICHRNPVTLLCYLKSIPSTVVDYPVIDYWSTLLTPHRFVARQQKGDKQALCYPSITTATTPCSLERDTVDDFSQRGFVELVLGDAEPAAHLSAANWLVDV